MLANKPSAYAAHASKQNFTVMSCKLNKLWVPLGQWATTSKWQSAALYLHVR